LLENSSEITIADIDKDKAKIEWTRARALDKIKHMIRNLWKKGAGMQ